MLTQQAVTTYLVAANVIVVELRRALNLPEHLHTLQSLSCGETPVVMVMAGGPYPHTLSISPVLWLLNAVMSWGETSASSRSFKLSRNFSRSLKSGTSCSTCWCNDYASSDFISNIL